MELIASLFCHVSESIPEAEIQRELQRQHDILAQRAPVGQLSIAFSMWASSTWKIRIRSCFVFCNARRPMILGLFL